MIDVRDTTVKTSYKKEDVILLLKDVTGKIREQTASEREKEIQKGRHYCEMLPLENLPTAEYYSLYKLALEEYAETTAQAVKVLAEKIIMAHKDSRPVVLVFLARAGLPVGVLVKHYIQNKYNEEIIHYGISIIRGKGIDHNAMKFILNWHKPEQLQFIDGWTGKGAILSTLKEALKPYKGVSSGLGVLADPAGICSLYGTREDFLVASSLLNSTASGLISRTILKDGLIGSTDFHGAVYYDKFIGVDETYRFISTIEKYIDYSDIAVKNLAECVTLQESGMYEAERIAAKFGIDDITRVKPGIGECTRVLLRRVPWKILVSSLKDDRHIGHIKRLAREKNVEVIGYPLHRYRAVGLIKKESDV